MKNTKISRHQINLFYYLNVKKIFIKFYFSMSCRICYSKCTLFTYLLPVNHRSSSVRLEDSGGETFGSFDTWGSLDSSGSVWKKTERPRSSNLNRPRTKQIKYAVSVRH